MAQIIYGYIRVSTKEQNEDRQRIALAEFPVPEENVFMDKLSGKDFNRPQYRKLLRRIDVYKRQLLCGARAAPRFPRTRKLRRRRGPPGHLRSARFIFEMQAGAAERWPSAGAGA